MNTEEKIKDRKKLERHGLSGERIYKIWLAIIGRCCGKGTKTYENYGAKGVSVCDHWKDSVHEFIKWSLSAGYADNLTIDRINTDKGYCPENCRWVDYTAQGINKRKRKGTSSKYRGVSRGNKGDYWVACVGVNKKRICIGLFKTEDEANIARIGYLVKNELYEHLRAYRYDDNPEAKNIAFYLN